MMNGGQRRQILLLRRQAGGSLTEGASEYQPEEIAYQVRRSRLIQTATTARQPTVKVREMAEIKVVMKATAAKVQTAMMVMMDQVEFRGNQVAREHDKRLITMGGGVSADMGREDGTEGNEDNDDDEEEEDDKKEDDEGKEDDDDEEGDGDGKDKEDDGQGKQDEDDEDDSGCGNGGSGSNGGSDREEDPAA